MAFNNFLNPILQPLFSFGPLWGIVLLAFLISLIITIVYKLMTDQETMKKLKKEIKDIQKKMKELKEHPDKVIALQKKAMKKNLEYMKHSFKPTLITFIPIILIFGWLHATYAYQPINPGDEILIGLFFEENTQGQVQITVPENFVLSSPSQKEISNDQTIFKMEALDPGEYIIDFQYQNQTYSKEIFITNDYGYKDPVQETNKNSLKRIEINQEKMKPLGDFSIFGWQPGWLAVYIICSIVFSLLLRKMMGLH